MNYSVSDILQIEIIAITYQTACFRGSSSDVRQRGVSAMIGIIGDSNTGDVDGICARLHVDMSQCHVYHPTN